MYFEVVSICNIRYPVPVSYHNLCQEAQGSVRASVRGQISDSKDRRAYHGNRNSYYNCSSLKFNSWTLVGEEERRCDASASDASYASTSIVGSGDSQHG